ncbi:MAG: LptE family protein, partial [Bacteroidetes bacterium]|nr:LptE family protein [Bacteroidota bacterium]
MRVPRHFRLLLIGLCISLAGTGCFHYSFNQGGIPKQVKTIRINYIENKARYINPQLSPQLTERLRQKINGQSGKTLVQGDNADYDISGTVTDYSFTTAAISGNRTASNRLNVTVHIIFKNHLDPTGKNISPADFEADVTRSFDFDAN